MVTSTSYDLRKVYSTIIHESHNDSLVPMQCKHHYWEGVGHSVFLLTVWILSRVT